MKFYKDYEQAKCREFLEEISRLEDIPMTTAGRLEFTLQLLDSGFFRPTIFQYIKWLLTR